MTLEKVEMGSKRLGDDTLLFFQTKKLVSNLSRYLGMVRVHKTRTEGSIFLL